MSYMLFKKSGLMWDILTEMGVEIREDMDFERLIPEITERFKPEWDFLHAMPHVIETPHYIFAHGGIKPDIEAHNTEKDTTVQLNAAIKALS